MMFKKVLLTTLILLASCSGSLSAEWQKAADLGLSLTQSSYNSHWTGGDAGSVSWIATSNLDLSGNLNPKFNLANSLKLSFGQTHIQDDETKKWDKPKKSSDRIFLESVGRLTLGGIVDPYLAVTFESQFLDASVEEVKRFINPITLTEAVGISRTFVDTTETKLISRIGLALRHFSDNKVIDVSSEQKERETRTSGGLEWVTDFKRTFSEDKLKYVTKLRLFQAVAHSDDNSDQGDDAWKALDVAWEHTISASIAKFLQVSLFMELLYDKEISTATRFKETLALGLSYKLF